jgi:hypothetical protein
MTKASETKLRQDRAARERARSKLGSQFGRVKADLAAKGIGSRAAQTMVEESREAAQIGLEVARERKGVVAGTIGALLLWLLRKPIIDGAAGAIARFRARRQRHNLIDRIKGVLP